MLIVGFITFYCTSFCNSASFRIPYFQIDIDPLNATEQSRAVHVSLAANPSHLEAVNPVVIGKTKVRGKGMEFH